MNKKLYIKNSIVGERLHLERIESSELEKLDLTNYASGPLY